MKTKGRTAAIVTGIAALAVVIVAAVHSVGTSARTHVRSVSEHEASLLLRLGRDEAELRALLSNGYAESSPEVEKARARAELDAAILEAVREVNRSSATTSR